MENSIEITYDEFIEQYKPIEDNEGCPKYFDTHDDWEEVKSKIDAKLVWTLLDGEGSKLWLVNGCWLVNRMEYIICKVPYKGERGNIELEY